jgi:hypothetical protein
MVRSPGLQSIEGWIYLYRSIEMAPRLHSAQKQLTLDFLVSSR